jgi:transient receptor potential cation channel subfamily M protein 2
VHSYTFDKMQQDTNSIWRYMQLQLVMEYSTRPLLPLPFILIVHLVYLARWAGRYRCGGVQVALSPQSNQKQAAFSKSGLDAFGGR